MADDFRQSEDSDNCNRSNKQSLDVSEKKYRILFESANDAIFTMYENRFIDCNPKTLEMFGCTRDQIIGAQPHKFSPKFQLGNLKSKAAAMEKITYAMAGEPQFFEWIHTRYDGTPFEAEVSLNRVVIDEKILLQAVVRDISRRKKAERALIESEKLYRTLLNNLPVGMTLTNWEGKVIAYNAKALEIYGNPDNIPKNVRDLYLNKTDRDDFIKSIKEKGALHNFETSIRRADKTQASIRMNTVPISLNGKAVLLSLFEDRTEYKRAETERINIEEKMRQAQKLESLGVLAGGIAHDFNNLLMSITGNTDLALLRMNKSDTGHDYMQNIKHSANRAADLVRQMLAYSGQGKFIVERICLNDLIKEMKHLLSALISDEVVFDVRLEDSLPLVYVDSTQIRQVIMNLIINASEAIGDNRGIITVVTNHIICDRKYLSSYHLDDSLKEGIYVSICVCDDGEGMDEKTRLKIFDPFFTTKFTGRGLGLAAVLGIVRGHNGAVIVESSLGEGTNFEILLPVVDRETQHRTIIDNK